MSKYANKEFWVGTADRAIATFAQAAIATVSASATGILEVDFVQLLSVAGLAAVTSVFWSFANPERVVSAEVQEVSTDELEAILGKQLERVLGSEPERLGKHGTVK